MAKKLSDKKKLRAFFQRASEGRTARAPLCRHFGECGGCEFQAVPYEEQLDMKRLAFRFIADEVIGEFRQKAAESASAETAASLLSRASLLEQALAGASVGLESSPAEFGYRQRMDYVFAFGKAGLRRANRHRQVIELEECPLLGEQGFAVFQKARNMAVAHGLESYDYMRHSGELRYFVVRRSRNGQTLLSLVTKSRRAADAVAAILSALVEAGDITSGHWLLAEGLGDVSFGQPLASFGRPWIVETLNSLDLRIGPNTFFQSNPAVAEKAYAAIRDFAPRAGSALDMYTGVGSIALTIASGAKEVIAVENAPENLELAALNRRENAIDTISFIAADSVQYLLELAGQKEKRKPDMVVVNPPRPGVEGGGMDAIRTLRPGLFAYLSCNPFTLLRNLSEMLDQYELTSLCLYDMFPQTRHFETLALLRSV